MDREHLTRLAQDPALTGSDDVADLRGLVQRYPWFSGAHLLLAVGGHRQGDVLFEEQLRASVAHLPSRAVLHDRLQAETISTPKRPAATPPEPATMTVVRDDTPPNVGAAPAMAHDAVALPAAEPSEAAPMTGEHPPVPPEPAVAPPPAPEAEAMTDEAPPPAMTAPAADPLDAQIRQSALASSYDLMLEHPAIASAPSLDDVLIKRAGTPPTAPTEPVAARSSVRRFSDWLEEPATMPAPAASKAVPGRAEDHGFEDTQALIARFVQQQGQAKARSSFFSPVQAARKSVEDHADLVTETLARILERQGNVQKAITAYERLAEKHPERRDHYLEHVARLKG